MDLGMPACYGYLSFGEIQMIIDVLLELAKIHLLISCMQTL